MELKPEFIREKGLKGHNILHIALLGVADLEMLKMLLDKYPILIAQTDNENLTPLMFGKKYGFGKVPLAEKPREMKKALNHVLDSTSEETLLNNPIARLLGDNSVDSHDWNMENIKL